MTAEIFPSLDQLASHLRQILQSKKTILLYAYNGTGKTRLSGHFKNLGKRGEARDTLYYNAFTEDLFHWNNDLDGDSVRVLNFNAKSRFFTGLGELDLDNRIRYYLQRYSDFNFDINYDDSFIAFSRDVLQDGVLKTEQNIKISRGEESVFIWCFFLAITQLAIEGADEFDWVKYIYVDDPVSSLDDNNAVGLAFDLAQLIKQQQDKIKFVMSSHHALFFNVMFHELQKANKYFLKCDKSTGQYELQDTGDTPFYHHVSALVDLVISDGSGKLYTHHFNMLRNILEKTANFYGHQDFVSCLKKDDDDVDGAMHKRLIGVLSHGNYSLFEPREMVPENKEHFKKILKDFLERFPFNPALFPAETVEISAP